MLVGANMLKHLEKIGNHGEPSQLWELGFHHRGHHQLTEDDGATLLPALAVAEIPAATEHHAGLAGTIKW